MDFSRSRWKDGMEMEAFPQGPAGGCGQPARRAHRAAEPGEHVLHECGAAVPLQPHPARAVFPLRKVEHRPARVSWFVHSAESFLLGTIFLPKNMCCHGNVQGTCQLLSGSSYQIGHQLVSLLGPSAWYFPCHIDGNTHYCWLSRWCFLPLGSAESLKPPDSCQSCTVPASVLCVSVSYPVWRQTLFFLISPETLPFFPREIGESATAFACLVSDMWLGEFDYVSPEAFHSVFGKRYPTFSRRTQHDAQEFLICVLDDLHEAFKEVRAQLWCFGNYSCFLCISWLSIPCNNCLSSSSELHDGARITLLFYLYFIPMYTQLLTFFLSNAPPNCSPNLNDNAGVASLLPLLDLSTLNVLPLSHLPEKVHVCHAPMSFSLPQVLMKSFSTN